MVNEEDAHQFPDDSTGLVWYPPCGADVRDRSTWAWLPGSIVSQCAADEWCVVVEAPELAEPDLACRTETPRRTSSIPCAFATPARSARSASRSGCGQLRRGDIPEVTPLTDRTVPRWAARDP